MAIYMKIDGIDGHITATGYEKWIELESLSFGTSRNISTKPGNVSDREFTKPTFTEVMIGKLMGKDSPYIFTEACVGKSKPTIQIHICQTGTNGISPYIQYTLSNVLISRYQIHASDKAEGTAPTELLNLNFDKIEMKYTQYDEKHNALSPIPAGYDLNKGTRI